MTNNNPVINGNVKFQPVVDERSNLDCMYAISNINEPNQILGYLRRISIWTLEDSKHVDPVNEDFRWGFFTPELTRLDIVRPSRYRNVMYSSVAKAFDECPDMLQPFKNLVNAGFPVKSIISQLDKHIEALNDLPEDTTDRDVAIIRARSFRSTLEEIAK